MNKNEYIKAMSGIRPSEEMIERIMDMTQKKKRAGMKKGILLAVAALVILVCGGLTANAATDGAVAEVINNGVEKVVLRLNGKEITTDAEKDSYVDDDGNTVEKYHFELPQGGEVDYELTYDDENEGVDLFVYADGVDGEDELQLEVEDFIEATTREVE